MSERWIAIVNPQSGGRRSSLDALLSSLQRRAERIAITEAPGHATALAAAAGDYTGILVAGGDGTVCEVLQGMNCATQSLALLPRGRGNSLARDLSSDPEHIDLLDVTFGDARGVSRSLRAASTVAVGYPVRVAETANRRLRVLRGACYAAAAAVTRPEPFAGVVQYGDGRANEVRLTGLVANNTRHIANFLALPRARLSDGVFDVLELRQGYIGQGLHNLSAVLQSGWTPVPPIPATRVQLSMMQPATLLVDGELHPDVIALDVRMLPAALTCSRLR